MRGTLVVGGMLAMLACVSGAAACSLCEGSSITQKLTLRQEAALPVSKLILHGTIANPMLDDKGKGGRTDFFVKTVLREDKQIKTPTTMVLPRYLPVNDPKDPPHYLVFCDVDKRGIDAHRGIPLRSVDGVSYVKKALSLDPKQAAENLAFFFAHLDDPDSEVSRDAFIEFAKAADADILKAGPKFSAEKIRGWLKDEKTPPNRLNVYAVLLGACGKMEDATYLRDLLDSKEERYTAAADGILAGYMQLKPKEGWELLLDILSDGRKPLLTRLGAVRTLRFLHYCAPKDNRSQVLKAMRAILTQGELADLAIEDLRKWKEWDLTDEVLKRYGQKGYDAPLIKRAIVRYALCCEPTNQTKAFLTARRGDDKDLVEEVEEYLKLEQAR